MILPGLVSLAFYRRKPTGLQVALGLALTIVLSGVLGYVSPPGPLTRVGSVLLAVVGGVALYFAILAYLRFRYQSEGGSPPKPPPSPPTA